MHKTLKFETARPARTNLLQQQERFDDFIEEFNTVRPHEALAMKVPAAVYVSSPRRYPAKLAEFTYPDYDDTLRIKRDGKLHLAGRGNRYVSAALAGRDVGIRELRDGRLLVTFADIDLGHFGSDTRIVPLPRLVQPTP